MKANVEFFKLIDPIGQSLLFIAFGYSFDNGTPYHIILLALAAWQLVSWVIQFFMKSLKLLKNERLIFLFTGIIYMITYFYITKHVSEKFVEVRNSNGLDRYPVHEIILIFVGLVIAFWYYIICFREVKGAFKKKQ